MTSLADYLETEISLQTMTFDIHVIEKPEHTILRLTKVTTTNILHATFEHADIVIIDNQIASLKLYNDETKPLTLNNTMKIGDWGMLLSIIYKAAQSYKEN